MIYKKLQTKHKKVYDKASKKSGLSYIQFEQKLYAGIESGEFCNAKGKPFSFNKMICLLKTQ